MIMRILISITLLLGLCGGELAAKKLPPRKPLTVLISIDGFKPEYLKRGITPNLSALVRRGAFAEGMAPSFPSVTFPNHITLVTGVEPDAAGFVTVWPCGGQRPTASNLNLAPGRISPNLIMSKIGIGGKVCIYTQSPTHLVADLSGYWP